MTFETAESLSKAQSHKLSRSAQAGGLRKLRLFAEGRNLQATHLLYWFDLPPAGVPGKRTHVGGDVRESHGFTSIAAATAAAAAATGEGERRQWQRQRGSLS